MKIKNLLLPGLALGLSALLLAPSRSIAYSTLGFGLSAENQRDFRIYNNFADANANNNTTPDANFPGWQGADMALWKGCVEWGSELFGDGSGDPSQTIGSGGANFDAYFAGAATGPGGGNQNIISAVSDNSICSGGVLAYTYCSAGGWQMRFCDNDWNWKDGPANEGSMDLQGVGCHEYGHSLGLGHSAIYNATMYPSTSTGFSGRSIETDDINGVKAIYGAKSSSKPKITGLSLVGGTLTITGTNFSASNNEVWFTHAAATGTTVNPHLKVTGLASTGGGTQIVVTPPVAAGSGSVLVKQNATGYATLSNAYPVDLSGPPPQDPDADFTASPTSGSAPLLVAFSDLSTGTNVSLWSWDFGDGGTSFSQNPGYLYANPGTYTVSLTVWGAYGQDTETKVGYITVTGTSNASATWRNGSGVNPDIYDSLNLPVLGTTWNSSIDGGAIGASGLTLVFGYTGQWSGFIGTYGEILLDPTSAWAFTDAGFIVGGTAVHAIPVPATPSFAGLGVSVQGFLNGVAPAGQLTNAWDLILGY